MSGRASGLAQMDQGQVAVIGTRDLGRISTLIESGNQDDYLVQRERERETLHARSNDRVQNWGNTIEALRLKKERRKVEKFEEEEAKRKIIDAEEATFQAEQRRHAIERANKILYDGGDRVKAFNSKALLCDVLHEREAQIDFDKTRERRTKQLEDEWNLQQIERLKIAEDEERRKQERAKAKAMEAKEMQMQQLATLEARLKQDKEDARVEGKMIQQKTEALATAERDADMERKRRERIMAEQTQKQNKKMQAERAAMQKKLGEAEDSMIRKFAEQKEANMRERASREASVKRGKMEQRKKMVEAQEKHLENLMQAQNSRLVQQKQAADDKSAETEAAELAKRQRQLEGILSNHAMQLEQRRQLKSREKAEEQELREQVAVRNDMLVKEEELDKIRAIQRSKDLAGFHKRQMNIKTKRANNAKEQADFEALETKAQLEYEDRRFDQYSKEYIDEYREAGKRADLLELEARRYKIKQDRFSDNNFNI